MERHHGKVTHMHVAPVTVACGSESELNVFELLGFGCRIWGLGMRCWGMEMNLEGFGLCRTKECRRNDLQTAPPRSPPQYALQHDALLPKSGEPVDQHTRSAQHLLPAPCHRSYCQHFGQTQICLDAYISSLTGAMN